MPSPIIKFLAKTYKVWVVIAAAVIFFLGYNAYLVDYSLLNLKIVLDKTADIKTITDAKRLASVLDYSILTEVGSSELQSSNISRIELAKDMLANLKDVNQLKDVKFFLAAAIKEKEEKKPAILVAMNNIGRIFAPLGAKFSEAKLESRATYLRNYIRTLEDKTKQQEAYYELANVYTKLLQFDKAKEAFKAAIALDPGTILAQKCSFNLAWNEKYRGNFDEAAKQFESLSRESANKEIKSFSEYQLADSLKKKGEYEKAAEIFQGIGKKYPREEFAQLATFQSGYINLYDITDLENAKKVFEEAKALFGDTSIVRQVEKEAFSNITKEYVKKGFGLLKEGQILLATEFYDKADFNFNKGLEVRPNEGVAYIGKALGYLWKGDGDKAIIFGERAVKLAPKEEIVSVNLGYIYTALNYPHKAIKEYKRYLAYNRRSVLVHYNLGYCYAISGNILGAVREFRQATEIGPGYAYAYNNLGWGYWQLRKYANAIDAFRRAVKLQPQFERAQFNLGQLYMVIGSYGEAKKAFESISATSPEYGQAIIHLREIENKTKK